MWRIIIVLITALVFAARAQNIVPVTQVNDITKLSARYYDTQVSWFAGDSIRWDVLAREGVTPIDLTGATFPVLYVAAETNVQQVYVVQTGAVVSATNGHVRVTVPAQSAVLSTSRSYSAWMTVYRVESAITQEIATVAYSAVRVFSSVNGTIWTNLAPTNPPFVFNIGSIVVEPTNWSAYAARSVVDLDGYAVTNGGRLYADASGLTNFPATLATNGQWDADVDEAMSTATGLVGSLSASLGSAAYKNTNDIAFSASRIRSSAIATNAPQTGALLIMHPSGQWTPYIVSGDASVGVTGALAIADGTVTWSKLDSNSVDSVLARDTELASVAAAQAASNAAYNVDLAGRATTGALAVATANNLATSGTVAALATSLGSAAYKNTTDVAFAASRIRSRGIATNAPESGHILIMQGGAGGEWMPLPITGDATVGSTGSLIIADGAVNITRVNTNSLDTVFARDAELNAVSNATMQVVGVDRTNAIVREQQVGLVASNAQVVASNAVAWQAAASNALRIAVGLADSNSVARDITLGALGTNAQTWAQAGSNLAASAYSVATGAAAAAATSLTNLPTLGGDLTGPVTNAQIAAGAVGSAEVNATQVMTQGGSVTGRWHASDNAATGSYAFVGGGDENVAGGLYSTVAAGRRNDALESYSAVGGGYFNKAPANSATIAGGFGNTASNTYATVGGGNQNAAMGVGSVVAGGAANYATSTYSTIAGGFNNSAEGYASSVGGGSENIVLGSHGAVLGGYKNSAYGSKASVLGGINNRADGDYSIAAGIGARATNYGSIVFSAPSSTNDTFGGFADSTFNVRSIGGAYFLSPNFWIQDTNGSTIARFSPTGSVVRGPFQIGTNTIVYDAGGNMIATDVWIHVAIATNILQPVRYDQLVAWQASNATLSALAVATARVAALEAAVSVLTSTVASLAAAIPITSNAFVVADAVINTSVTSLAARLAMTSNAYVAADAAMTASVAAVAANVTLASNANASAVLYWAGVAGTNTAAVSNWASLAIALIHSNAVLMSNAYVAADSGLASAYLLADGTVITGYTLAVGAVNTNLAVLSNAFVTADAAVVAGVAAATSAIWTAHYAAITNVDAKTLGASPKSAFMLASEWQAINTNVLFVLRDTPTATNDAGGYNYLYVPDDGAYTNLYYYGDEWRRVRGEKTVP